MAFTDLHEIHAEMAGYTNHGQVTADKLDKVAGRHLHDGEWMARDRLIPKTPFEVRAERWAARAARATQLPPPDELTDPDQLRRLLRLVRQAAMGTGGGPAPGKASSGPPPGGRAGAGGGA
jgi:hypothetical protein